MTNLSTLPGFSAGGGGGGGGASEYTGSFVLDHKSFNLQDENKYLEVTNMNSYFQTFRIRGFDTTSKAYIGSNCMVRNGQGGNMQHACTLFSVNQSNGVIAKEQVTVMHNNGSSTSDYSTYDKTSDEWTGRYTYQGHIPCNSQSHNYSYHQCFLTSVSGGKASNHTSRNTYYPTSNNCTKSSYVEPAERRHGGAVRHFVSAYDQNGKANVLEYYYNYSTSQLSASRTDSKPFSTSQTSTNYQVPLFNQWDVTNSPYYDAFQSFAEGLYAHNRSSDSWQNLGSGYSGPNQNWFAFFLSNGGIFLSNSSSHFLITQGGSISSVSASTVEAPLSLCTQSQFARFCWNVGQDEWLLALPNSQFSKFTINPSTGAVTMSNVLTVAELKYREFAQYYQYERGFYSAFSPSTASVGSFSATFGTENNSGPGYGKSKLVHISGNSQDKKIHLATYDLSGLVADLAY